MDKNSHELAVKAQHDAELEAMEAEVMKTLSGTDATQAQTDEQGEEIETPASESAPEEINQPPKDDTETETPPAEKKETEAPKGDDTETAALSDDEVKLLSKKAQKRFQQMSETIRALEEKERIKTAFTPKATPPAKPSSTTGLPWDLNKSTPQNGEPREITEEDYNNDVQSTAAQIVQKELAKEKILVTFHTDVETCEKTYPELDPNSDEYDENLASKVTSLYWTSFQADPSTRLKAFVDDMMSIRTRAADAAKSKITAKVVKQAGEQAIGSTPTRPTQKGSVDDLIKGAKTIADLEALESMV